jgi:predicted extracellular nuclease
LSKASTVINGYKQIIDHNIPDVFSNTNGSHIFDQKTLHLLNKLKNQTPVMITKSIEEDEEILKTFMQKISNFQKVNNLQHFYKIAHDLKISKYLSELLGDLFFRDVAVTDETDNDEKDYDFIIDGR